MTTIDPLAGPRPAAPARPSGRRGGAFELGAPPQPAGTMASAVGSPVGLDRLLAVQEDAGETVRDRAARRQGQAILALLGRLQRSLLSGEDRTAILRELATLAAIPVPDDPRLAAVLRAIAVRAAVESARRAD